MPRFYETTLSIINLHNLSISTHVNCSRIYEGMVMIRYRDSQNVETKIQKDLEDI